MHTPEQLAQRAKINCLLYEGTQEEWVQSIRDYANLPDAPRQARRRPAETSESIPEPTTQTRVLRARRPIKLSPMLLNAEQKRNISRPFV